MLVHSLIFNPLIVDINNSIWSGFSNQFELENYIVNYVVENDPLYSRIGGGYLGKIIDPFDKGMYSDILSAAEVHKLKIL